MAASVATVASSLLLALAFGEQALATTNSSHVVPATTVTECTLQSLSMRFGGQPIDLEPPFRPYINEYVAYLDFAMDTCSVHARPDTGCEVDGVPTTPVPVQIGGQAKIQLYARNAETQEKRPYEITVKRLLGSETDLQLLRVENSAMSPVFDPNVRSYVVRLGLGCDEARIVYRLRDNAQRIRTSATQEKPQTVEVATPAPSANSSEGYGNSTNISSSDAGDGKSDPDSEQTARRMVSEQDALIAPPRKLSGEVESGEVQVKEDYVSFMVDVGFSREVTLTVQCADATQADIGTYKLELSRPSCIPQRPFFDPEKSFCVDFCPSGYYKSKEMNRCAKCNTDCVVCDSLLACRMCQPDTPDYEYVAQPDGSCHAYANHIFKKYRVWCVGLAVLLFFLVLIGCAGICSLCCGGSGGHDRGGKYKQFRTYSDSEEELTSFAARKPVGHY